MAVALITGCSSGFGKLIALELARRGDSVFATVRTTASSSALLAEAEAEGLAVDVMPLDVRDGESVKDVVTSVLDRAGRIDILVNNAGIDATGPVEAFEDDELDAAFQTNVFGAHRVTRAVLPSMRARRDGVIIIIGSLQGRIVTFPFNGVYAATKHAIQALYEALYFELQPFNIRVITVEPGSFVTDIWKKPNPPRAFAEGAAGWSSPGPAAHQEAAGESASEHADVEYTRLYMTLLDNVGSQPATADPAVVARLVAQIAHERQPNRRYVVGEDAEAMEGQTSAALESQIWELLGYAE